MQNVGELTQVEQIALGALKAEAQRLNSMNAQFNAASANVTKEIETAHPGYTLDQATLKLVAIPPAPVAPEIVYHDEELSPVVEMPSKSYN